jgi:hypothetical protein
VRQGAAWHAERPSSCLVAQEAVSRWQVASPPSLHGLPSAAVAVHRNTVGRPSARSLGVVAQEVRMPAVLDASPALSASSASVRRPVFSVRCQRPVSTRACPLERCPVSGAGV